MKSHRSALGSHKNAHTALHLGCKADTHASTASIIATDLLRRRFAEKRKELLSSDSLDEQLFDGLLHLQNLRLELRGLIRCDGRCDDRPRHTTCAAEGDL